MFDNLRRSIIIVLLVGLLSLLSACSLSQTAEHVSQPVITQEQLKKLELFNQTAEDMYQKTSQGDIPGALIQLDALSAQIPSLPFEGITTAEGIQALTETVTKAKRTFAAANLDPGKIQLASAQVRLAADALNHRNQPMWLQYYKLLQEDLSGAEKAVKINNKQNALGAYSKFDAHIATIKPSLLISKRPDQIEELESLMTFTKSQLNANPMQTQHAQAALHRLKDRVDDLFNKKDKSAYLPLGQPHMPVIWTTGIGSFIIAGLAFSAWEMFQRHKMG
jgi:sporulation protein YpjB